MLMHDEQRRIPNRVDQCSYYDNDADLNVLKDKAIAFVG